MNEWDLAVKSLKDHWRVILLGLATGFVVAVLIVMLQKPVWESQMVVAPSARACMPGLSSFLPKGGQAPAIQYLIERMDTANSSDFERFETLVNSPRLAAQLIAEKSPDLPKRDARELAKWLDKNVRIRGKGATGFRQITLRHHDPDMAIKLLNDLHRETDMMIRRYVQTKTARRMTYLKEQLQKTFHPDHKDALVALLKEQEQTAMMVSIDKNFAAEIIDPPSVPVRPVAPDWRILFPAMMMAGIIFGLMIGGFIQAIRRA